MMSQLPRQSLRRFLWNWFAEQFIEIQKKNTREKILFLINSKKYPIKRVSRRLQRKFQSSLSPEYLWAAPFLDTFWTFFLRFHYSWKLGHKGCNRSISASWVPYLISLATLDKELSIYWAYTFVPLFYHPKIIHWLIC